MDFSKPGDNLESRELMEDFALKALQKKYHLVRRLHQDNLETVYVAKSSDLSLPTKYFIQRFTPQYASQEQLAIARKLFNQEVAMVANLGKHPQIPSIYDYFETQGQFFVVQEFISGQSFQAELSEAKFYSEQEIIVFLNTILPVLNLLHENNYIHRDIKPSNLLINSSNQNIYLINFNSIREKITPQNIDITGQFIPRITGGTQGYMPMEQYLGKPEFCSDIYALGIVVIQALTNIKLTQLQYDANNNPAWHHLLPNINNFSSQFLNIIDTMVRCDYHKRYQSAIAILASLKKLNSQQESTLENTIIQQPPKSIPQSPEITQIISNQENAPQNSERTLIINNSELTPQTTENTLIIQNDNIDSTRIINPKPITKQANNNQKDENQSKLKILAIIGIFLMIIAIIMGLSISRNNRDSVPQNSSSLYLLANSIPQH